MADLAAIMQSLVNSYKRIAKSHRKSIVVTIRKPPQFCMERNGGKRQECIVHQEGLSTSARRILGIIPGSSDAGYIALWENSER
jgi:hypothetical protein